MAGGVRWFPRRSSGAGPVAGMPSRLGASIARTTGRECILPDRRVAPLGADFAGARLVGRADATCFFKDGDGRYPAQRSMQSTDIASSGSAYRCIVEMGNELGTGIDNTAFGRIRYVEREAEGRRTVTAFEEIRVRRPVVRSRRAANHDMV